MTVECIACARFTLRDSPLARHGFGFCALRPRHEMQSAVYPRECQHHQPAKPEQVETRRDWLTKAQSSKAKP